MKSIAISITLWTLSLIFLIECNILGFKRRLGLDLVFTSLTFTFMVLSHLLVLFINLKKLEPKMKIGLYFSAFQLGFIGLILCIVSNAEVINDVQIILLTSKTLLAIIELFLITIYFTFNWTIITIAAFKEAKNSPKLVLSPKTT